MKRKEILTGWVDDQQFLQELVLADIADEDLNKKTLLGG